MKLYPMEYVMKYNDIVNKIINIESVEKSIMIKMPRMRYKGEFAAMLAGPI